MLSPEWPHLCPHTLALPEFPSLPKIPQLKPGAWAPEQQEGRRLPLAPPSSLRLALTSWSSLRGFTPTLSPGVGEWGVLRVWDVQESPQWCAQ